jgi:hypothetical protein
LPIFIARGGERMMMVGRGNDHRVEVLANFVEHLAIVAEKFCLRISLDAAYQRAFVHDDQPSYLRPTRRF